MGHDAYVLRDHGVIIFWSRKSGNTSLTEWLALGLADSSEKEPKIRKLRKALKKSRGTIRIETAEALELIRKERYEDYVLARNPFRRVISAYVEKFLYYRSQPLTTLEDLKKFAADAYREASEMSGRQPGLPYRGLSFTEFLQYIAAKVRDRRPQREPDLNGHWNTQVPLRLDGQFTYKNVIKLENIDREIQPLAQKLNWTIPFPQSRKNALPIERQSDADLASVPSVELLKSGVIPTATALLNSQTRQLIREAYEIDFRMLNYDPMAELQQAVLESKHK